MAIPRKPKLPKSPTTQHLTAEQAHRLARVLEAHTRSSSGVTMTDLKGRNCAALISGMHPKNNIFPSDICLTLDCLKDIKNSNKDRPLLAKDCDILAWLAQHIYKIKGIKTNDETKTESRTPPLNTQEGGDHYKDLKIQPVEYIHANGIGFAEGNVIKYVTRWKNKNGIQDLKKARHFLDLLIQLETENAEA